MAGSTLLQGGVGRSWLARSVSTLHRRPALRVKVGLIFQVSAMYAPSRQSKVPPPGRLKPGFSVKTEFPLPRMMLDVEYPLTGSPGHGAAPGTPPQFANWLPGPNWVKSDAPKNSAPPPPSRRFRL